MCQDKADWCVLFRIFEINFEHMKDLVRLHKIFPVCFPAPLLVMMVTFDVVFCIIGVNLVCLMEEDR